MDLHFYNNLSSPQNIMSLKHLVRISQCGCLPNDVSRMEKIMTDRINVRDYDIPTSNHFLQLFISYCQTDQTLHFPHEEFNERFYKLVLKLEACLCHFALLQFRVSRCSKETQHKICLKGEWSESQRKLCKGSLLRRAVQRILAVWGFTMTIMLERYILKIYDGWHWTLSRWKRKWWRE